MRKTHPTPRAFALATLATGLLTAGLLAAAPNERLAKIDANGDGNISLAEHDAMRAAHLAELDGNRDGYVTFEEQKAAREARRDARQATAAERFTKRHDKDGDGRVSVDELAQRGDGMFARMDKDGDGLVTREEMLEGRKHRGHRGHRGHDGHAADGTR